MNGLPDEWIVEKEKQENGRGKRSSINPPIQ